MATDSVYNGMPPDFLPPDFWGNTFTPLPVFTNMGAFLMCSSSWEMMISNVKRLCSGSTIISVTYDELGGESHQGRRLLPLAN